MRTVVCPCCAGEGFVPLPEHTHVGERIHWLRRAKGLSVEELAARVGKKPPTIRNIESGRYSFSVSHLHTYADALGVEQKDLLP